MKHKSLKYYKARADRLFSLYIRQRDADENGYCKCITCKGLGLWSYFDSGHFMLRQNEGTRYHEKNANVQCKGCNNKNWKQGLQYEHGKAIDKKFGDGTADKLTILSKITCYRSWFDYKILGDEILEKLKSNNFEIR